jgi:alcohol dehydrogenase (cytochrome c)
MKRHARLLSISVAALLAAAPAMANGLDDYNAVTAERLVAPAESDWLQTRRTYDGQGHSPLAEITTENVAGLEPVWSLSTGPYKEAPAFAALPARGAHQSPAIVNDGVMFMTTHDNQVIAVDAATGEEHWRYRWELPPGLVPVHPTNRGVALWDDKVYLATLDAHLVALDATTGEHVWDAKIAEWLDGYYMTLAPLVVDGNVMVGVSGGEFGIRGFVEALDAETGERVWKTYTIPAPGEPGSESWPGETWKTGGGPVWITGNYDAQEDVAYFGVGNAAPWVGALRPGDNLYTTSTIGLDPETGEIVTHFQYHWNGSWDWDEVVPPTLIDIDGEELAVRFARNGWIYKLNREGGELSFVDGRPYVYQDVFTGLDAETGRPSYDPQKVAGIGVRAEFCPSAWGGRDWPAEAYNPNLGTVFISVNENHCGAMEGSVVEYEPGVLFLGSGLEMTPTEDARHHIGALQAWDVRTLEKKWQVNFKSPNWGPVLSTEGGLVFVGGTNDAKFRAFDAETGDLLWEHQMDGGIVAPPTSFAVDGKQYVAVTTGWGVDADRFQGFIDAGMGTETEVPQGGTIWVFALP